MHTLITREFLSEFTVTLAELSAARVKVFLDLPRRSSQGRWTLRLLGPKLTLLGFMFNDRNTNESGATPYGSLTAMDLQSFEFKELDFKVLPFMTSLRLLDSGNLPHNEEVLGLYSWAMRNAGMQLELRADGTLALRAATRRETITNVQRFKENFRRLRYE